MLSHLTRVSERLIYNQIEKNYKPNCNLITMLEKWILKLDKVNYFGTVLMDLPQASDIINHGHNAILYVLGYKHRFQKLILMALSGLGKKSKLVYRQPQGSPLGPLIFNMFFSDVFYSENRLFLINFAYGNILYMFGSNLQEVNNDLHVDLTKT